MLGNNMFAYCRNNPVILKDPDGLRPLYYYTPDYPAWVGGQVAAMIHDQIDSISQAKQHAVKKYNQSTVNVYYSGSGSPDANKVNAKFYDIDTASGAVNIQVDQSKSITSRYEINAVLDVIISSEYYSKELFGSKEFMHAQWLAHNWSHDIAASGEIGFTLMSIISGSSNPIESGSVLDIRSTNNMLKRQKLSTKLSLGFAERR